MENWIGELTALDIVLIVGFVILAIMCLFIKDDGGNDD